MAVNQQPRGLCAMRWILLLLLASLAGRAEAQGAAEALPAVPREFRGVWIATVSNLDWPSRKGLPVAAQQEELRRLFDKARELKLNAVIFQVRPAGDAFYPTALAPWSDGLTGQQGRAPDPMWDPLEFAVREAHARGLELHAWFNPYRAAVTKDRSRLAPNHFGVRNPQHMVEYDRFLWLMPTSPAVQQHMVEVVRDVVARYDVDGVHFDDYFYPYPVKDVPFPDDAAYQAYRAGGGTLNKNDWRREGVNTFLRQVSAEIKRTRPTVRFGISPFGIWQPGHPAGIRGLNAYEELFADARLWLHEGIVDYMSPQLYWSIAAQGQSFPVLLDWWIAENRQRRHIWPGIAAHNVPDKYDVKEVLDQIGLTRQRAGSTGQVMFRMQWLAENRGGLSDALRQTYPWPALVPPTTWLGGTAPEAPLVQFDPQSSTLHWQARGQAPFLWVVMADVGGRWWMDVMPAHQTSLRLRAGATPPRVMAVSAVDRLGNESPRAVIRP